MDRAFYKEYFELEQKHWWFLARRNILLKVLRFFSSGKARILDVGCGSGFLVGQLQQAGVDASGMDMSQEAIEFGRNRGIKNLSVAEIPENFPANEFDAVLCLDVLEHLESETEMLKNIRRVAKSDGTIIVTVPAFKFLWGVQDDVSHHYRRYTKNNLEKLLIKHDFKIIYASYFNFFLFPIIAGVRLLDKLLKIKRQSDFEMNSRFINGILYAIFNLEKALIPIFSLPFGVSIILIAKKA